MKLSLLAALLVAFIVCGSIVLCIDFVGAQSPQNVSGILNVNTTWTKAGSPYTFTGSVSVSQGVTLTVEPGVTVNLGNFYLQVNGTLRAKGTNTENIHFNGGGNGVNLAIIFTEVSTSYNEQTGSGSIIENVVIDSHTGIDIHKVSPKINNNTITGQYAVQVWDGSQVISNNIIHGSVGTHSATPTITGNTIFGEVYGYGVSDSQTNNFTTITNNKIYAPTLGEGTGIYSANTIITGNIIYGFQTGITAIMESSTIQRNLIINNQDGIVTGLSGHVLYGLPTHSHPFKVTIQNNEITQNANGIAIRNENTNSQNIDYTLTITNNNIENNRNYNFYLSSQLSVDVPNNWWGTADTAAIDQTIYDFKEDFSLGTVNYTPILSHPDPQAPSANVQLPVPQTATPTPLPDNPPSSSAQPTVNPTEPSSGSNSAFGLSFFETLIVVLLAGIVVCLIVLIVVMFKRKAK